MPNIEAKIVLYQGGLLLFTANYKIRVLVRPVFRPPDLRESKFEIRIGEPHRNRTCNLLIKSQLLCQLS